MDEINELKTRFHTDLLQCDLILLRWEIIDKSIRFHYVLGTIPFYIDEVFSISLSQDTESLYFQKLVEYFGIVKSFKYTQHFLAKRLIICDSVISKEEQDFWQEYFSTYSLELFYTQQIDPKYLIKLEFRAKDSSKLRKTRPTVSGGKMLLGVGGGKDAIYGFEIMRRANIPVDLLYTYWKEDDRQLRKRLSEFMQEKLACDVYTTWRGEYETPEITQAIEVQWEHGIKPSAPAVSVNALRMEIIAWSKNYSYITTASERSADTGNTIYFGRTVNHQYSKSIDFESKIISLLEKYIHPDIHYFSCLKPLYEIKIAEQVSLLPEYFGLFTSCNRSTKWCLNCPKCAFVFTIFAAFLSPEELKPLFSVNLFEKESMQTHFLELMGLTGVRPFECVGESEEMNLALFLSAQKGHTGRIIDIFHEKIEPTLDIEMLKAKYFKIYLDTKEHCIPARILEKISWEFAQGNTV